jgi:hypothetical protein
MQCTRLSFSKCIWSSISKLVLPAHYYPIRLLGSFYLGHGFQQCSLLHLLYRVIQSKCYFTKGHPGVPWKGTLWVAAHVPSLCLCFSTSLAQLQNVEITSIFSFHFFMLYYHSVKKKKDAIRFKAFTSSVVGSGFLSKWACPWIESITDQDQKNKTASTPVMFE